MGRDCLEGLRFAKDRAAVLKPLLSFADRNLLGVVAPSPMVDYSEPQRRESFSRTLTSLRERRSMVAHIQLPIQSKRPKLAGYDLAPRDLRGGVVTSICRSAVWPDALARNLYLALGVFGNVFRAAAGR